MPMYVFPVLTTPNISKNILIAICRTLEHYLIVYHTDEILQTINQQEDNRISVHANRLISSEQKVQHRDPNIVISIPELKKKPEKKEVKIDLPQRDAMTLEPTYVTIDHPTLGKQMLAIKALPFKVKSPEMMLSLLSDDYSAYTAVRWLRIIDRTIIRFIWKFIRAFLPFSAIRNRAVTGDIEKDVIYGFSKHSSRGKDVFVLFDRNELTKEISDDAPKVKKLFGMYWPSFVVVDDVEKTATYCMEGFNGLCSTIHYPFLLASIGSSQKQVYDDLEEVRKSASQFFRLTTNKNKVLECSCIGEKDKHINELTRGGREVLIEDDVLPIVNRLTDPVKIEKTFKLLKQSLTIKDDNLALQAIENIPLLSIDSLKKFGKKGSPNFLTVYDQIKTVLTNSTKIPETLLEPISLMLGIDSSYKVKNSKQAAKENLLTFVPVIRKIKITTYPVRACVRIFLDTLADSDKAGLAAGLLLLKICLNSISTQPQKEETDDGSEV